MLPADPLIRRRWLIGIPLVAIAWILLLGPVANALFGLPGAAPTTDLQADRLIYEELVKLALLLGVAGLASWLGLRTLITRSFPPTGLRVPVPLSVNRGTAALVAGSCLLVAAVVTLAFRIESLRVTLELAGLLRRVG